MNPHKFNIVFLFFCLMLIAVCTASILIGTGLSVPDSIRSIGKSLFTINMFSEASSLSERAGDIMNTRLARIVLAMIGGAGLAVSGAILQSLLRNSLADPYFIGVSAGASFGSALMFFLPIVGITFVFQGVSVLAAFLGALGAVFAALVLARSRHRLESTHLILAGIAISTFLTAMVSGLMILRPNQYQLIVFWTLGSFADATWEKVLWTLGPVSAGIVLALVFARDLNLMLLGEEKAQSLGLPVEKRKKMLLAVSALMAASVVASAGIIVFAGLIIPHIARLLIGSDNRKVIPLSAVLGAVFLLAADTLARNLFAPDQIPISIITALAGAPFFIFLLVRKKNDRTRKDHL
ncbi:MAG: iron ABC transporter permease [Spirochaetales bacterium]|nr:iron ABC transporter permease [Spirochaetales bacterium]